VIDPTAPVPIDHHRGDYPGCVARVTKTYLQAIAKHPVSGVLIRTPKETWIPVVSAATSSATKMRAA
jgi:hypothetical protein